MFIDVFIPSLSSWRCVHIVDGRGLSCSLLSSFVAWKRFINLPSYADEHRKAIISADRNLTQSKAHSYTFRLFYIVSCRNLTLDLQLEFLKANKLQKFRCSDACSSLSMSFASLCQLLNPVLIHTSDPRWPERSTQLQTKRRISTITICQPASSQFRLNINLTVKPLDLKTSLNSYGERIIFRLKSTIYIVCFLQQNKAGSFQLQVSFSHTVSLCV